MISAWNLIWIIPLCIGTGILLMGLAHAARRTDEGREEHGRKT